MELPELTQQPIKYIDGTPDANYPLRILEAYRHDADCRWKHEGEGPEPELMKLMNMHCEQRAAILDAAIKVLRTFGVSLQNTADGFCPEPANLPGAVGPS